METKSLYVDVVMVYRNDDSLAHVEIQSESKEYAEQAVHILCALNNGPTVLSLHDVVKSLDENGKVSARFVDKKRREALEAAGVPYLMKASERR